MEDLNTVKSWENSLRKEIEGLKDCKEKVSSDASIPKVVKDRFVDVLRSLKMTMIQVMAKCAQLRTENLNNKALKVRTDKLKFEYEEVKKNLDQLMSTVEGKPLKPNRGFKENSVTEELPAAVSREILEIKAIIEKTNEQVKNHVHGEYEQRIEALEAENQELRRNLSKIVDENTETFELIQILRERVERLENSEPREPVKPVVDLPRKRVLLKPTTHAEELLRN